MKGDEIIGVNILGPEVRHIATPLLEETKSAEAVSKTLADPKKRQTTKKALLHRDEGAF